jgi:hypothetical protein
MSKKDASAKSPKTPKKPRKEQTLTSALAALLAKKLLPDLAERAKEPGVAEALAAQHAREREAKRTADRYEDWSARLLEQVGAAWILSCVFVRTLEDRDLLSQRRLAGPGATDAEQLFFELFPAAPLRDYLLTVFKEIGRYPGAAELLGPAHNPAWRLAPSSDLVRELLSFFREEREGGGPRWTFGGTDTRHLGDLYQDLSESVRERYALLQTPDFVEAFILDQTLEPAIASFGLEQVTLLDPTCGSGHFLLGAYDRLVEHRKRAQPGLEPKVHALAAIHQVAGVDLNPYAVAIARVRLTLAYVAHAGAKRLVDVPPLELQLVVADSLLHGAKDTTRRLAEIAPSEAWGEELFRLEDPAAAERLFARKYHAVVGNPPYITCKDAALRDAYRQQYASAAGQYALSAPFTERFFQLAVDGGYVGMINANSFMKREFGKKLIEEVLPQVNLTRVIDTAGAYIPGHGTPTVLLFGRNQRPVGSTVRAVLGKRGEPTTPEDPKKGLVWSEIARLYDSPGTETEYLSVTDVERTTLSRHPWSLGGGGAAELKALIEARSSRRLSTITLSIGRVAHTGNDEAFVAPEEALFRRGLGASQVATFVEGESLRDWSLAQPAAVLFPYDGPALVACTEGGDDPRIRWLWPFRAGLWLRREPNGTHREIGLTWYEFSRFHPERFRPGWGIAFPFVATHNHFVLDRGGKVFKQTAPIIKLPEGASEEDHLALLGYLNSSTACFWMKQVFYPKARSDGDVGEEKGLPEANRYEFTATGLLTCPIPSRTQLAEVAGLAAELNAMADRRSLSQPAARVNGWPGTRSAELETELLDAEAQDRLLLGMLVARQEDLDWKIYSLLGLCSARAAGRFEHGTALEPNERPFNAPSEPRHLTSSDLELWRERRRQLESIPELRFIETPVFKRRWWGARGVFGLKVATYRERAEDAAVGRTATAAEAVLSRSASPVSTRNLRTALRGGTSGAILEWLGIDDDGTFAERVLSPQAVPYLAALRYTDAGLDKRAAWERVWDLQRAEDRGEAVPAFDPPPKYDPKDFRDARFFSLRGKLDVPKERFIAYPGAERDDDKSPLFGWAGWDHLQQAQALAALYQERKDQDGWGKERLTPLLAGILELIPWLLQWHNEPSVEFEGERLGDYYDRYLGEELRGLGLTREELGAWRPEKRGRGRR